MNKFKAFPSIEVPGFLSPWEDHSWGNDSCGAAELPLHYGQEYPRLRLWVEYDDPEKREDTGCEKFVLEMLANEDQYCNGKAVILYAGEDAAQVETIVKQRCVDKELKAYHFSCGNSSRGPVGFCAVVKAHTKTEACEILASAMPQEYETEIHVNDEEGRIVYFEFYLNSEAITPRHIDEVSDADEWQ